MVVLHVKRSEQNSYLYETNTSVNVGQLIKELVESKWHELKRVFGLTLHLLARLVNNLRLKLDSASIALEDLASKGPQRCEELRGLDDLEDFVKHEDLTVINGLKKMPPQVGSRQVQDETNHRTGWVLSEEMTKQMLEESMKGKQMIHKTQVDRKVCLTIEMMQHQLDIFRGLVMMGYPGYHGLGDWEPIRIILENQEESDERMTNADSLDPETTTLWIVSKELQPQKAFSDHFGKNEKQKLVCKLQKRGSGAPQREPALDQATHSEMLKYYHKKQEEHKKLEEENADDYLNAAWADNRNMKAQMHGTGAIKWRGGGGL